MNKSPEDSEEKKPQPQRRKPRPVNPQDRQMPLEEEWAPESRISKKDLDWLL